MKKPILYVLAIILLLQSCHTYKKIDLNTDQLIVGHKYKIKVEKESIKGRYKNSNDSVTTFRVDFKDKIIAKSEIKEIKKREFSIGKTITFVPLATILVAVITYIMFGSINTPNTYESPN